MFVSGDFNTNINILGLIVSSRPRPRFLFFFFCYFHFTFFLQISVHFYFSQEIDISKFLFLQYVLTSMFFFSTLHVAIIVVIQFPPKLSRNIDVIMEFRYGMCWRFFSDNDTMTYNDKYITTMCFSEWFIHYYSV